MCSTALLTNRHIINFFFWAPIRPIISFVSLPPTTCVNTLTYGLKQSLIFDHPVQSLIPSWPHKKPRYTGSRYFYIIWRHWHELRPKVGRAWVYTNIPLAPTFDQITSILSKSQIIPPIIDEFLDLLKLCVVDNICKFNNNLCKFQDGLQMGSPISSLLADIFMSGFETKFSIPQTP